MVAQFYKNESGEFVPIPGPVAPVNEVVIQASEPTDPNVKVWIDTADDGGSTAGVPVGSIIAYCGTVIPHLWHPCDGTAHGSPALFSVLGGNNVPDLRSRFIIGESVTYPHLSTGGGGTHTHPLSNAGQAKITQGTGAINLYSERVVTSYTATHQASLTPAAVASTAALTTGSGLAGATDAGTAPVPPYYALIYIIKKA